MASGSDSPPRTVSSPPNKRLKTLASSPKNIEEFDEPEPKGKQPMLTTTDGLDSSICCGICWSDGGKAIRGFIDSCDHYFCFVCIMEWAKIESRCPMCKRRFAAIRRPPKDGVFPTERVVLVPERNQVSYLYGVVAGNRSFDPFANVECNVCHGTHDESLLLLCDLCDSASHTFCVGLGATVPEGDWFCHDCSVSRTEHDSIRPDNGDDDVGGSRVLEVRLATEPRVSMNEQPSDENNDAAGDDDVGGSRDLEVRLATEPRVSMNEQPTDENNDAAGAISNEMAAEAASLSIHDIVHEENFWMPGWWRRPRVREGAAAGRKRSAAQAEPAQSASRNQQVADDAAAENGARTLRGCRNVHTYIRSIRENWDSLRAGSVRFSSSTANESSNSNTNAGPSSAAVLPEQNCLRSPNAQQLVVANDSPGTASASQETQSDAIDKAWKMMLRAKSVQLAGQRVTTSMQQVSKCPSARLSTLKEAANRSFSLHFSRSHQLGTKECRGATPGKRELHSREITEKQVPSSYTQQARSNMQKHVKVVKEDRAGPSCSLPTASSSPCPKFIHESRHNNLSQKVPGSASKSRVNDQNRATCLSTADAVVRGALQTSASTPTKAVAPSGNVALHNKAFAAGDGEHDEETKTEIQSLVKLNLKLLSRDKHLGVERFKEVARASTHTILAACGLEHSKRAVRSIPSPVCKHGEEITECSNGNATPIPNCCRDCFLGFVKKVVKSILSEKQAS